MLNRKHLTYNLEYIFLRIVQSAFKALPRRVALTIGLLLGTFLYFSGAYRKTVKKNLQHTGIIPESEIKKFTYSLYRNMGLYITDFLRGGAKTPPYNVQNFDLINEKLRRGNGVIVLLAHLGNWEILADIFGSKVGNVNVVAKPMKNPIVENWLHKKRCGANTNTIYTRNALRKMYEALIKNQCVAILIDQHVSKKMGTPAPFLGKTANTVRTVAGLIKKTGTPVVVVHGIMTKNYSYDIHIQEIQPPDLTGLSNDEAITMLQTQHNDVLSELIRKYPEHWFGWFHKRFKGYINYKEC
ncbi:lysophospholipid acyltransferase family protein [Chitinispirillales bacterium ANBcel5]|uniref:lysophospholipid acyltransferase family protein n=1 Tax=Cellulosispirillum alkaliphilum TaxID=3039283 RepID=UPI002A57660E|nr:lysophospholipid acyltransferase family protein [Chitinispirillales bacterium ANBcel5]